MTCTADTPQSTGTAEQAVINPPLPSNLNLILNAKTTVTIGAFTTVSGDVGSVGLSGSAAVPGPVRRDLAGCELDAEPQRRRVSGDPADPGRRRRLEPSEPVVILVTGGVTTGIGSAIRPSAQSLNPMTAGNIRIEVGGAVTLGDSNQIRAHLLVTGKFATGKNLSMTGAAWAKTINIGTNGLISSEGVFSAQAPSVPPPCNDNNACTADACVGSGTQVAFCRNTPTSSGTLCEDGNACNGVEQCDGNGQCQPGTNVSEGTSCSDNNACNGSETCNGFGTCLAGTPPEVSDRNACTADSCDASAGVSHVPVQDGTRCLPGRISDDLRRAGGEGVTVVA